ncbi:MULTISPECIES: type II CAAX endopeptidase family protein [unclassified Haloferax]|jgi:membrane protease YdiL (CAAX protease family)|uniref:CPBP family intramembrane glutamic endopeptidase n=1 Tax=unclassified Haloferax TaxID=2625095 RepID=UPI0028756E05|nr:MULTISPECIES: type II CAAX endopeptidase family protein [unclassified Haloferax]MDS0241354.1 CPBP family intramembrane metalloprotease [Haloferax sp. S2CR25]MDS0444475.1 CPBP family intramembrane metalloprotease [Haloferax sp. S2CR25-2]
MPEQTPGPRLRALGASIGLALGAFIVGNIVVLGTGIALETLSVPVFSRPARMIFLSTVLLQGVTFGGIALVYLRIRGIGLDFVRVRLPTLRDLVVVVGGSLVLLSLLVVVSILLSFLEIESAQNQIIELGQQNPLVFLILVPLSFLLVGPGEELLFRGLIQGRLGESFSTWQAIVLASGIFGIVHITSLVGQGKFVYIGVVFALALVLGATYEYTDNLVVPALVHGAYNAVQFGAAYLMATGFL